MKKNLLWTMAAAFALASCSDTELVEVPSQVQEQDAVAFSTYLGDNAQGRATVVTTETLEQEGFGVNAWYTKNVAFDAATDKDVFMDNTKVTYNKDKGAWTYSPLKYWPNMKDHKVSFFAYGPYKLPGSSTFDDDKTAINFTVESEAKDQVDLIYNTNYSTIDMPKPAVNTRVEFKFDHALARIAFSVEAAVDVVESNKDQSANIDANTVINVKRVALVGADVTDGDEVTDVTGPFYTTGTLSLLEPAETEGKYDSPWSGQDGTQGFLLDSDNFYRTVTDATSGEVVQLHKFNRKQPLTNEDSYLMIIPQDLRTTEKGGSSEGFKIYIEYDVITKSEDGTGDPSTIINHIVSKDAMSVNFEQGKAYNFNLVLGMASVQFDASVAEWDDSTPGQDEWLPENKDDEEDDVKGYKLVATKYLTHNGTNILIEDANDLGEARDLINAGSQYKFGEGEDNKVYKVDYANEDIATIDDDYTMEGGDPIVMPDGDDGGEGDSEAEPTFPYFYEAYYLQKDNVTLSGEWTPIAYFDGTYTVMPKPEKSSPSYYEISGLAITEGFSYTDEETEEETEEVKKLGALFARIGGNAKISNIRMTNVNISNVDYAAAIVAQGSGAFKITNCVVGTSDDNSTIQGTAAAGICTESDGGTSIIENSTNYATVKGENVAGISNGYATVEGCENHGAIGDSGTTNASGISAYAMRIVDCHNYGTITGNLNVGGIIYNANNCTILASHNEGQISTENLEGAVVGSIVGTINNSPNCKTEIIGCYSTTTNVPLVGHVDLESYYEEHAKADVYVNITSCYSLNSIIGKKPVEDKGEYDDRIMVLTCKACYYTAETAFADDLGVTSGVDKVESEDNHIDNWSSDDENSPKKLMNSALSSVEGFDWNYVKGSDDKHPLKLESNNISL